ncbi:glycosyltransferase involved in cell wall biosynthesis [Algoriphagus ratkowskyi]|uniref:Glycosyltransferase n=1 Tax=Algoriphagus ratkowskyi TaxID=57028 RepID=A0A2W7QRB3_9BACT|nr:glycosyltransferase [Algoriphagus ratkowskyi]PZX49796.1 glycosyltransferase involved in cell wall biosynthesis [Algoriphagus ratkowskyi]TXD75484.1 glycosyltransferase [Algoriphagus ratkowskyi]
MDNKEIDISVVLLTYNQEYYVRQALDSILNQNFTGRWEIIVGDDCSLDNTANVIEIGKGNFDFIKVFTNSKNLGLSKNYEKAILLSKGKYIAYIEGDDYWTDEFKLQKQFDFLELNPKYVLAFHDFVLIDNVGNIISESNLEKPNLKKNRSKKEMVAGCLIHQNTMMFRNVISKFPLGFFKSRNHDTFLIAYLSNWGLAGYVYCKPLHYRYLNTSLWSSLDNKKKHLNGIITYWWIFTIAPVETLWPLFLRLLSKIRSFILSHST